MSVGGEYAGQGMFGGIPMASSGIVVIPPPTGLPRLAMPSQLTLFIPQHELTQLTINEYDTVLRIVI